MVRTALLLSLALGTLSACGNDDAATDGDSTPGPADVSLLPIEDTITLLGTEAEDAAAGIATGDFDGDGETDILLGAAFADGPDNAREDAGEVLVFLGPFERGETRDSAAGGADTVVFGAEVGDQAGRAVAAADVNGDSIDDIVIGAPFVDGSGAELEDAGAALVILGSDQIGRTSSIDLRDAADITILGPSAGALTGFSLAAGDLNGDAFDDLLIGSFQADGASGLSKAGAAHAILGSTTPVPVVDLGEGDGDVTVYGPSQDAWLGETVNTGDFNGDGLDDLLLTAAFAPSLSGEDAAGQVSVVLSPAPASIDLASARADYTIYGAGEGDQVGHSSAAGDVDGDGRDDILLGAVSSDGAEDAINLAGEAVLVYAANMQSTVNVAAGNADAIAYGTTVADRLGRSVALGDVDGDGMMDLILGLPGVDSPGAGMDAGGIFVVYSAIGIPNVIDLRRHGEAHFGDSSGAQLTNGIEGRPALAAADLDGDGRDEILVSSSDGGETPGSGVAFLLFVGTD